MMKKINKLYLSACLIGILSVSVTGCANSDIYSGSVYRGAQAKSSYNLTYGTIVSARQVRIQGESAGVLGTVGGGAIGGIAGRGLGGGRGSDIFGVLGAVAGSALGSAIEQKMNQTTSLEMVIRKDDGTEIVVVQKAESSLRVGARVRIVGSGSDVTVSAL